MTRSTATRSSGFPILDQAHEVLRNAVSGLVVDAFTQSTPCSEWNVGQVINHALLDQLIFAATVTGTDKPEGDAFRPSGIDANLAERELEAALTRTADAFRSLAPDAGSVEIPLPPFNTTAQLAAGAAALDAGVHGWDIARAAGKNTTFSDALATQLLDVAYRFVDPVREWGAYAPVRVVDVDAGPLDELLAYVGRDPNPRVRP